MNCTWLSPSQFLTLYSLVLMTHFDVTNFILCMLYKGHQTGQNWATLECSVVVYWSYSKQHFNWTSQPPAIAEKYAMHCKFMCSVSTRTVTTVAKQRLREHMQTEQMKKNYLNLRLQYVIKDWPWKLHENPETESYARNKELLHSLGRWLFPSANDYTRTSSLLKCLHSWLVPTPSLWRVLVREEAHSLKLQGSLSGGCNSCSALRTFWRVMYILLAQDTSS